MPLDDVGLPIHGAMPSLMRWEATRILPARITARLLWTSGEQLRLFPFPHELTVDASLERGALTIATTLAPTGEQSVPVSFGYHPYLRIPDEKRSRWQVMLGARERLLLDEAMIPTGEREPVAWRRFTLAEKVFDDGFDALEEPGAFEAAAGDVALRVEFLDGYSYAQVYAPAYEDFICFEPMTAPSNALVSGEGLALVAPGGQYRAAFRVSISGVLPNAPLVVVRR
jgi:aldose 1-epimerase